MIAPVGGIKEFAQAIGAGGDIWRDERGVLRPIIRCDDAEGRQGAFRRRSLRCVGARVIRAALVLDNLDAVNPRCRRRLIAQRAHERVERGGVLGRCLDVHAVARVEHPAAYPVRHCHAVHKRPHAHALNDSGYVDVNQRHSRIQLPLQARAGGGTGELAVVYAAQAEQLVGEFIDARALAAHRKDFQAVVVVQVHVHG